MDKLIAERKVLADDLSFCERGAFPGSKAYREESAAIAALSAFDAAHPEVLAEIRRRQAESALGDKDILGM